MRRVVYREVGPKRRRRRRSSTAAKREAATTGGTGFGQLLARLFNASSSLDRSRARVGGR